MRSMVNYRNKKVAITGIGNGFIADKLARFLEMEGATVWDLSGDIRDPKTFSDLDYSFDYLFHFAAPSSQVLFKRKTEYCVDVTIKGFLNAVEACRKHGIKLIYPSTGILSHGVSNEYARCKKICEDVAIGSKIDALGVRIFASYGPTEGHKRDYASVPFLFIRDMVNGKRPLIYGDGKQVRDFIYIDDVIKALAVLAEECNDSTIDIGSGITSSFNDILEETSNVLLSITGRTAPQPVYVDRPAGYVDETHADVTELHKYYVPEVKMGDGIKRVVEALLNDGANDILIK